MPRGAARERAQPEYKNTIMDAICRDGCFADLRRRGPSSDATIDLAVSMEQTGVDDTLIVIPVRKHPRCMAAADYADRDALLR